MAVLRGGQGKENWTKWQLHACQKFLVLTNFGHIFPLFFYFSPLHQNFRRGDDIPHWVGMTHSSVDTETYITTPVTFIFTRYCLSQCSTEFM